MKLVIPEQKKLIHTMQIPIRWGDMDAMGHVNNTLYFRYMEIARLEWMAESGVLANPAGEGPVIANAFCNFIQQLTYPGDVRIQTFSGAVGRSSFDTYHELRLVNDPHTMYANGGATVVWVDFPKQKSVLIPDRLRDILT